MKIDKILENKNSLYIIAEFELGGHFYSFLMKQNQMSEKDVQICF